MFVRRPCRQHILSCTKLCWLRENKNKLNPNRCHYPLITYLRVYHLIYDVVSRFTNSRKKMCNLFSKFIDYSKMIEKIRIDNRYHFIISWTMTWKSQLFLNSHGMFKSTWRFMNAVQKFKILRSCRKRQAKLIVQIRVFSLNQIKCYTLYSHLSNSRGGWNKRGRGTKVAKSINLEVGINVEGGIFWKQTSTYLTAINEEWRVEKI